MTASDVAVTVGGLPVHLAGVVHLYPSAEGDVVALGGIDLDVGAGESMALLGPSGAGKSTVLALLAGEFAPSAGVIRIGDHDIGRMSADALARLHASEVSLVVQGASGNLLGYASAFDNVWFAQHGARRRKLGHLPDPGDLLDDFGLGALSSTRTDTLSAGQRQRVALVVGVASMPGLLLIDEPTSQLGAAERDEVIATIEAIHQRTAMTIIVVTHDPDVAQRLERTVTIRDGRVGAEGRSGTEYAIVGRDGSLHLPPEVLDLLPPESLVHVVRHDDRVELRPAEKKKT